MIEIKGNALTQWEKGRQVQISCKQQFNEVQFSKIFGTGALIVKLENATNTALVEIPNEILQSSGQITIYAVLKGVEIDHCIELAMFNVAQRAKPSDYVYTKDEVKSYEALEERIKALENASSGASGTPVKIGEVTLLSNAWEGENNLYSQIVSINGVTENSQVDLTPSVEQLTIFYEKDITFVAENEHGVVTVYAIGQKPLNDYTIQVTITETEGAVENE